MHLRSLLVFVCALWLTSLCFAEATEKHPQDGPDVSLLFILEDKHLLVDVTMNLAYLDEVVDVAREDEDTIDPYELPSTREALIDYFAKVNQVWIDGVEVTAVPGEIHITPAQEDLLPLFPSFGARALTQLTFGLEFPAKTPPEQVLIRWGSYPPDRIQDEGRGDTPINVAGLLIAYGKDTNLEFTTAEPEFSWRRPSEGLEPRFEGIPVFSLTSGQGDSGYRISILSLGLALIGVFLLSKKRSSQAGPILLLISLFTWNTGWTLSLPIQTTDSSIEASEPSSASVAAEASAIFTPLHANIYRAFDYTNESDIYDALARSVSGELLDSIYSEVYESLVMREEGGAVSRVQAVLPVDYKILNTQFDSESLPSFEVDARWRIEGAVHHWGHSHTRLNEYRALYTVSGEYSEDGDQISNWRITNSRILEQFRVASEPIPETL